jgi:hypothetical protein
MSAEWQGLGDATDARRGAQVIGVHCCLPVIAASAVLILSTQDSALSTFLQGS